MWLQNAFGPKLNLSLRRQQSGARRLVLMESINRLQHLHRVIALTTDLGVLVILVETIRWACMLSGNKFIRLLISDPLTSLHHLFLVERLDLVVGLNDGVGPLVVVLGLSECLWLHFKFALIHFYALELLVVHCVHTLLLCWDYASEIAAALWSSDWFLYLVSSKTDTFRLLRQLALKLILAGVVLESIWLYWQSRVDLLTWLAALAHVWIKGLLGGTRLERLSSHLDAVVVNE